jgi:hypothetical protein
MILTMQIHDSVAADRREKTTIPNAHPHQYRGTPQEGVPTLAGQNTYQINIPLILNSISQFCQNWGLLLLPLYKNLQKKTGPIGTIKAPIVRCISQNGFFNRSLNFVLGGGHQETLRYGALAKEYSKSWLFLK